MLTHIIDDIRNLIGRTSTFYIPTTSGCPTCSLDPLTDTSVNSFCPECSGLYYITTYSGYDLKSHITWGNMDEMAWGPGGQTFEGDCRLQVKYTIDNLDIVKQSDYVMVDNTRMRIDKYAFRVVPELNRIIILSSEEERNDG
jgi:hypothetical protein